MLSEREKDGVRQLLEDMPSAELINLSNTVTNRLITVQHREDAVTAIISYTANAEQFLRRKLVKRDLLFLYLAKNNVLMSPSSDKSSLIMRIRQYWGSSIGIVGVSASATAVAHQQLESQETQRVSPVGGVETVPASRETSNTSHNMRSSSSHNQAARQNDNSSWNQELAPQFSSWFFKQLNSQHPNRPTGTNGDWGPQHFLGDAKLKLCVKRGSDLHMDNYDGSELVARRLGCLVSEEHLLFNPNLTPQGTRGCSDPHGLVVIMVCGSLHQTDACVGVFEQNFGLVRDPLTDNNWKIKFVNLQVEPAREMPTLETSASMQSITA